MNPPCKHVQRGVIARIQMSLPRASMHSHFGFVRPDGPAVAVEAPDALGAFAGVTGELALAVRIAGVFAIDVASVEGEGVAAVALDEEEATTEGFACVAPGWRATT